MISSQIGIPPSIPSMPSVPLRSASAKTGTDSNVSSNADTNILIDTKDLKTGSQVNIAKSTVKIAKPPSFQQALSDKLNIEYRDTGDEMTKSYANQTNTESANISKMAMMDKLNIADMKNFEKVSGDLYKNGDVFGKVRHGDMIFRGFRV